MAVHLPVANVSGGDIRVESQSIISSSSLQEQEQGDTKADEESIENAAKKQKISSSKVVVDVVQLAESCWQEYRCLTDDNEDEDEDEPSPRAALKKLAAQLQPNVTPNILSLTNMENVMDMLPLFLSVVYLHLANDAIEFYWEEKSTSSTWLKEAREWISLSLHYYPHNAGSWSVGANLGRTTQTLSDDAVLQWYEQAAADAVTVRQETLHLLETKNYDGDGNLVKEWMELLLLTHVTGVDYIVDEDTEGEEENGYFSSSSVEATSRYMASMLLSRGGEHDRAKTHLKAFHLTHRLHPNVWTGENGNTNDPTKQLALGNGTSTVSQSQSKPSVVSFRGGILPPTLYQRMTDMFEPNATFWKETNYANRGYYSFFADIVTGDEKKEEQPTNNLIHDVVVHHLLPLATQVIHDKEQASQICGYEWWVHTRNADINLGHTLHFDTDDCFLEKGDEISSSIHHPLLSSVLYLTGNETSGTTIVLDQNPDSDSVEHTSCWRSIPHPNSFMVFPGNYLHGVLPGQPCCSTTSRGKSITPATTQERPLHPSSEWILPPTEAAALHVQQQPPHRLTFMVGFKTRHVPEQTKGKDIYGPCAPLPPNTEQWVKELQRGYEQDAVLSSKEEPQNIIQMQELPRVSPAWETISSDASHDHGEKRNKTTGSLELPTALDHHFFVHGAPQCFRDNLFDKDDDEAS